MRGSYAILKRLMPILATSEKLIKVFEKHYNCLHLREADKTRLIEYLTENN